MFKLDSNDAKADRFYNYAKALAILRENLLYTGRTEESEKVAEEVAKAMRALVKQIQE